MELVVVMVVIGIIGTVTAFVVIDTTTFQASAFRDQVQAALRYAQKTAVSHRRLVCATFTTTSVTLTIASANPATSCTATTLNVATESGPFAQSPNPTNITVAVAPAGPLYFQPSGVVASDGAGTSPTDYTVTVTGQTAVTVVGETGYVN